ncbi:MAG: coniferyl aldehyde dehydrogenase [Deltaproteobacteria bacterium]|nr:coniferyl aldehyde dehydrogenase [Deltaproteobacteria bacterium]
MNTQSDEASNPVHQHQVDVGSQADGQGLVGRAFDVLREAHRAEPYPSHRTRIEKLANLHAFLKDEAETIADTISADFGSRSRHETRLLEVFKCLERIRYIQRNLETWMRPSGRAVPVTMLPGRAKIHYVPLGVVGVIAPWNYPVQLSVVPTAYAIAAGNRVLLKPSEFVPRTSALLAERLSSLLGSQWVQVVTGGPSVAEAVARSPLDHLIFTGSTAVGRRVMRAAAENLVPLTLELGGKSPCLVHPTFPVRKAAERIAYAKWLNGGQTCVGPDYVLIHEDMKNAFVEAMVRVTERFYPTLAENPDYTAVISERHVARLTDLVRDAEGKGAKKTEINPAGELFPTALGKFVPTILTDVREDMAVMQEEIFGPVLPVLSYRNLAEALAYIAERPKPLAFYYFDLDPNRVDMVLEATQSGGASINDVGLQWAVDDLPFGGVGPSGMGAYHGVDGFSNLSHKRSVFYQAKLNATGLANPPFGAKADRILKFLIGR